MNPGSTKLQTPDVTTVQRAVIVTAAVKLGEAFGLFHLSRDRSASLTEALGALTALALFDAWIRSARAKHLGVRVGSAEHLTLDAEPPVEALDAGDGDDDGELFDESPDKPAAFRESPDQR